MLKVSNWENKVKKEEGVPHGVFVCCSIENVSCGNLQLNLRSEMTNPPRGSFSNGKWLHHSLNYKHRGVFCTIINALSFILKVNCWFCFYFGACFVCMQKSSIFMNTFSFLLVLMTIKGSKCAFTLHWLKTDKGNKKLHNAFIYFPANTISHPRPYKTNAPILFSWIHADLHVVELLF